MDDPTHRFAFPELPDEAVIALYEFIEAFYNDFQNHYFAQMHRRYQAQRPDDDQMPLPLDPSF